MIVWYKLRKCTDARARKGKDDKMRQLRDQWWLVWHIRIRTSNNYQSSQYIDSGK